MKFQSVSYLAKSLWSCYGKTKGQYNYLMSGRVTDNCPSQNLHRCKLHVLGNICMADVTVDAGTPASPAVWKQNNESFTTEYLLDSGCSHAYFMKLLWKSHFPVSLQVDTILEVHFLKTVSYPFGGTESTAQSWLIWNFTSSPELSQMSMSLQLLAASCHLEIQKGQYIQRLFQGFGILGPCIRSDRSHRWK